VGRKHGSGNLLAKIAQPFRCTAGRRLPRRKREEGNVHPRGLVEGNLRETAGMGNTKPGGRKRKGNVDLEQ